MGSVILPTMFDTVYFDQERDCLGEHDDWYVTLRKPLDADDGDGSPQFISAKHKDTKITLSGSLETGFDKVRVPSLASLLHGQNGMPLNGPQEVAAAFDVLDGLLSQVSKPKGSRSFTRVDMALNLHLAYSDIEYGLWGSALKQGRKVPMIYPRESITFRRAATKLIFYDKVLRTISKDVPDVESLESFVRVELSLEKNDLKVALNGGAMSVQSLDYMRCYRVLRDHILEVAPAKKAIDVNDTDGFLAWLYRKAPSLLMPYIERGGGGRKKTRGRKLRKIARMAATIGEDEMPWSEMLPVNRLPEQIQLFYPTAIKEVFHQGLVTHPVTDEKVELSDVNETVHERLIRKARYRNGIGVDPWGETQPVKVDSTKLGLYTE
jgi:hypothetical protein